MEEPTNEMATYKVILVYHNEKTERRFCHGAVFQVWILIILVQV